nr:TRAP transporter substrate-binding protein DctP [uncultured Agathobaculum sp.]
MFVLLQLIFQLGQTFFHKRLFQRFFRPSVPSGEATLGIQKLVIRQIWSVFSLPYLWKDGLQAVNTVMDDDVKALLNEKMQEYGFMIIAWTDIGSRSVLNQSHPVESVDDMVGLKLRCMEDTVLAESVNAMGAIATPMASSEIYTALQQGTIDGLDHTPSVIAANSWYELCKYLTLTEHFTIPDPVFVSKSWFDRLSPENQEAILEAGEKFSDQWNNEIWAQATQEGLQILEENGVEILEVDKKPFQEKTQAVVDDFLANASEDQKELYDLLIATREKY